MRIMLRTVKFQAISSALLKISTKERLEPKGSDQLETPVIHGKSKEGHSTGTSNTREIYIGDETCSGDYSRYAVGIFAWKVNQRMKVQIIKLSRCFKLGKSDKGRSVLMKKTVQVVMKRLKKLLKTYSRAIR